MVNTHTHTHSLSIFNDCIILFTSYKYFYINYKIRLFSYLIVRWLSQHQLVNNYFSSQCLISRLLYIKILLTVGSLLLFIVNFNLTISSSAILFWFHAAAAAKSLQSCPTLCDPRDSSPPGSPVPGILQARTLEWVAISFSKAWKWKVKVKSLSCVQLLATPWTAAYQAPPSMGFARQEYWSGVPLPSPLSILSKSLIRFSVDGRGCVPSLLFDLRPNYDGGNEWWPLQRSCACAAALSVPIL